MSDSEDEDLLLTRTLQRLVLAAVAVCWRGLPLPDEDDELFRGFLDRAALPAGLAKEVADAALVGVRPEDVPDLGPQLPEKARLFALRLRLLDLRLGSHSGAVVDALCGPPDEAAARLRERVGAQPLGRAEALAELLSPPSVLYAVLHATRPAEARRRRVALLNPARYRHELDGKASAAVTWAFPFDDLARKLSELVPERVWRLMNTSSNLRVGPQQLPELYSVYQGCVRRMGIHPEPPLYLSRIGFNAFTSGVEQPFVVLGDVLVGVCSRAELEYVIGHELGHIVFDHLLLNMVARIARIPGALLQLMPIVGPLIGKGLDLALFEWSRKAELSCDRAGLLACQDPQAAWRVMLRFAGGPVGQVNELRPEVFLEQYKDLEGQWDDLLSSLFYVLSTAERTHPWTVVRAHELSTWIGSGSFDELLSECPWEDEAGGPLDVALNRFAAPSEAGDLHEALRGLAARCREAGLPEFAALALESLAGERPDAPPAVVFLGERYRGHERLVQELQPLVDEIRIVDTPFLGEDEERFAAESMPELLCASAVVACASAAQMLGERERERLGLLLRLVRCPVALVVGRMDVIESEEDDRDVRRRAERFAGPLGAAVIYLAPVEQPHEELVAWLGRACEGATGESAWRERVRGALVAVELLCGDAVPSDAMESLRSDLAREHHRALEEARAVLRQRIARVRAEAPVWLDAMSADERRHEGVSRLLDEVGEAADSAGRTYLAELERSLASAATLARVGEGLQDQLGGVATEELRRTTPSLHLPRRGERSTPLIATALGTLAVGALFVPGAPVWVAATGLGLGVASYMASGEVRAERDKALGRGHRDDIEGWLDRTEQAMAARLDEVAAGCLEALESRLRAGPISAVHAEGAEAIRAHIDGLRQRFFEESA